MFTNLKLASVFRNNDLHFARIVSFLSLEHQIKTVCFKSTAGSYQEINKCTFIILLLKLQHKYTSYSIYILGERSINKCRCISISTESGVLRKASLACSGTMYD